MWVSTGARHAGRLFAGTVWSWANVIKWTGYTVLALLIGVIAYLYFLDWNTMRGPVSRYVSQRLGREVRIHGELRVHLFSWTPSMSASGITIANPEWVKEPLAGNIGRLTASVRLLPLLRGKTILPSVEIDRPDISVVRNANGDVNWDIGISTEGLKIPPIHHFIVRDGHLKIDDRLRKLTFVGNISSRENAGGGDRAFQLSGDGSLNGNKFLADVHGGALIHVNEDKPYHFTADIHSGTTHVTADGALSRPFHLGRFTAAATFSGASMADLYYLTGLVFPTTAPYRLSATATRDGSIYHLSNLSGVVGASDLHGEMVVDAAQTPPFVRATFSSRRLDFVDLGPLIGAPPVHRAKGAPPAQLAVGQTSHLLPDMPLQIERIRHMNADIEYDAATIKSQDFPLRDMRLHAILNQGVMTLDPITFDFTRGKLTASLRLDARKDVAVSDVDARLSNVRLEQFVASKPPAIEGLLAARAKLHATGNSVRKAAANATGGVTFIVPSGAMRKAFAELTGIDVLNGLGLLLTNDKSSTGLRCAVGQFDAHDGILSTRQLTLDTDDVLIQGQGTVNLKDETVDMSIEGHPKVFRIGRLRAPITVGGSIDHPSVGIKAGAALGQGGVGAALGLLNPFAAILAFVDPGLAKDANCAVLTQTAAQGKAPVKAPMRAVRH
jgi:AsmA family protein